VIEGEESSRNEVAANTGFGNAGAFIELEGHSNSEIPNGLEPPTVTAALQSSATGTAVAGTKVRIFSKAKPEAGELGGYLGVRHHRLGRGLEGDLRQGPDRGPDRRHADERRGDARGGDLGSLRARGRDRRPGNAERGSSSGSGASNPPPVTATTKPKVKILSGPKKSSTATTAKFKFKAEPAAGAKFECKLDGAKWAKCSSPKSYRKLKPGKHTFRVRAIASGLTGAATKFKFTVKS